MSDLISRREAIEAADRTDCRGLALEDVTQVTDEVVKELKKLPSAQSQPNWIPCSKRLPNFEEHDQDYVDGYYELGERVIFTNYYSPLVIATIAGGDVCVGRFINAQETSQSGKVLFNSYMFERLCGDKNRHFVTDKILAWMPLPEAYKEGLL